ncbi:MAG: STAS domain-containing protein [SAR324 cluster bacterium]|nr:STAS domain-containing protein [SAR324 cluster bacterium]MBF0352771.1 STAS domain-containing protein [SAR324 cluster bacterium]
MQVEHQAMEQIGILHVSGHISLRDIEYFRDFAHKIIDDPLVTHFIMNLEKVSFIDSSGIGIFIHCWRAMSQKQGYFVLCGLNEKNRQLIQMTTLPQFISIHNNLEEAMTRLQEKAKPHS